MNSVGIDGCKYGWVAVSLENKTAELFRNITEVIDSCEGEYSILIDIPIGLPSEKCTQRLCETMARKMLAGSRKSSVFPVPCREAVYAGSYISANEINRKVLMKGVSKQTWLISSKIKEVDIFLKERNDMRSMIKESHPELSFHWLNNGESMQFNKKTKAGLAERMEVLMQHNRNSEAIFEEALKKFKRKDVARDDILDAICLAIVCNGINRDNNKSSLPMPADIDETGIEMAVHYYNPKNNFA